MMSMFYVAEPQCNEHTSPSTTYQVLHRAHGQGLLQHEELQVPGRVRKGAAPKAKVVDPDRHRLHQDAIGPSHHSA